jgi:hypothetical protein
LLTGAGGERKAHAVGFRKGRDESSPSAMEASDCFQFVRGLTPGVSGLAGQLQTKPLPNVPQVNLFNHKAQCDWEVMTMASSALPLPIDL